MTHPNGTRWESKIVEIAESKGFKAIRLAKMGFKDVGDVLLISPDGDHYIIEAKWRERLNVHETLGTQVQKVAKADLPWLIRHGAVWWKRSRRKPGNESRSPAGPPVVCLTIDDYLDLLL